MRVVASAMKQNKVQLRILLLAGLALLWVAGVFGRLVYLQLFEHSRYMTLARKQQRRVLEITPKRGVIYDRNMQELARSVPVQSAFVIPSEIKDVDMATRLISNALGMQQDVVREKLESGATFAYIQRKLSPEKVQAIAALNLKGIYFQEENQRFYPNRDLAAHVLGFVDVDDRGLGGIEHEYDELIRSKGEKIVVMSDAKRGSSTGKGNRKNPVLTSS